MARYILSRVAEDFGVAVTFNPKLLEGWSGSGCHANFTTENMRLEFGLGYIMEAIKALEHRHSDHMKLYGEGNE
jgi:glutamine synthetase